MIVVSSYHSSNLVRGTRRFLSRRGRNAWRDGGVIRPISLLRLSLLRFLDSLTQISRELPTGMRIPPLRIQILSESNPPKARILVWRLAVPLLQLYMYVCIYIYIYRERERCYIYIYIYIYMCYVYIYIYGNVLTSGISCF